MAHGIAPRTATAKAHGNVMAHDNGVTAHGNDIKARQRHLPCEFGTTHGKECVAVRDTAVRSLPCVHARQSLCRAFWPLCRAGMAHGKALFSGSGFTLPPKYILPLIVK
jgi:hypothetical protein